MPNMMDYLKWRGDLTMDQVLLGDIDAMIFASFVYNRIDSCPPDADGILLRELAERVDLSDQHHTPYEIQWRDLFYAMAKTERFGSLVIHDYVNRTDAGEGIQFCAVTVSLPDNAEVVCFRGTDHSLVGWHEDFAMAYESPVPAQRAATAYLEAMAKKTDSRLIVVGHSKGGNLAAYAAAHAEIHTEDQLTAVYSFDGPGLDDATMASEGYRHILPTLHSFIPQSSVVGLLMNYHTDYEVVASTTVGIWQHDMFTWQLDGPRLVHRENLTLSSRITNDTMHAFLKACTPEERRSFVEAMFDILNAADEPNTEKLSPAKLLRAMASVSEEQRRRVLEVLRQVFSLGAGSTKELVSSNLRGLMEELAAKAPAELKIKRNN